jgi:subtilisin family serine protease
LQASAKALRLDQLHQMATGRNVRVAEIDTGVDVKHPDLDGQLARARNFVDGTDYVAELHGTAVAGIIVAKADNGIGIVGIAPAATLMPLRACWQSADDLGGALCSSFTLAKAIQYALTQRAHVLNLSLAGPRDRLLERLIDKAIDQGVTVIGAMDPAAPAESFPATHPQVIAVASASTGGTLGGVILAPGDDVLTTTPNASWGFVSGTSFATAHVTGITALLLELSPNLKPREISAVLHENAHNPAADGGAPVLNACAMLAHLSKTRDCHCCEALANPRAPRPVGSPAS